jgi:hypothetical protein
MGATEAALSDCRYRPAQHSVGLAHIESMTSITAVPIQSSLEGEEEVYVMLTKVPETLQWRCKMLRFDRCVVRGFARNG